MSDPSDPDATGASHPAPPTAPAGERFATGAFSRAVTASSRRWEGWDGRGLPRRRPDPRAIGRTRISERTKEGLAAARARDRWLGRPNGSLGPSQLDGKQGEISMLGSLLGTEKIAR
jgi:hypothetical protein